MRATHAFLCEQEILEIKPFVPQAIEGVGVLVVAGVDGAEPHLVSSAGPVGFMGVQDRRLEHGAHAPAAGGGESAGGSLSTGSSASESPSSP